MPKNNYNRPYIIICYLIDEVKKEGFPDKKLNNALCRVMKLIPIL